jgi:hypothetical protein
MFSHIECTSHISNSLGVTSDSLSISISYAKALAIAIFGPKPKKNDAPAVTAQ